MRNRMENNYKTSNHTQDTPARTYIYNNNTFSRTVQSKFKRMSRRMSTSSSTTHTLTCPHDIWPGGSSCRSALPKDMFNAIAVCAGSACKQLQSTNMIACNGSARPDIYIYILCTNRRFQPQSQCGIIVVCRAVVMHKGESKCMLDAKQTLLEAHINYISTHTHTTDDGTFHGFDMTKFMVKIPYQARCCRRSHRCCCCRYCCAEPPPFPENILVIYIAE